MEKKEKKGFWASLFSAKPCKCASNGNGVSLPENPSEGDTDKSADTSGSGRQCVSDIKVLGPGCAKCKSTYAVVEKVVRASGMEARLTKVDDIEEIMRYNIMATPAIVVDGKVVMKGKVPTETEVRQLLGL